MNTDGLDRHAMTICNMFLNGEERGVYTRIAAYLSKHSNTNVSREAAYPVVRQLFQKHALLLPPKNEELAHRLADSYHIGRDRVRVVESNIMWDALPDAGSLEMSSLGAAAAEWLRDLVRDPEAPAVRKQLLYSDRKGSASNPDSSTTPKLHIGFSSGRTAKEVARSLSRIVASTSWFPKLVLHAINTGFEIQDPTTIPTSFFGFFAAQQANEYVGLFSSLLVEGGKSWEHTKKLPGIVEAFDRRHEISVVVTSAGDASDPRNHLRLALERYSSSDIPGRRGYIAYRPYDDHGPIVEPQDEHSDGEPIMRTVSVFELEDLKKLAAEANKISLLVVGGHFKVATAGNHGSSESGTDQPSQSDTERSTKWRAIHPLLCQPKLRVWSHVLLDTATAQDLLSYNEESTQSTTR